MAKLVTSDGVQINLFLDLDSHNTGEGTLLYGPKSQAEMDFIVKGFRNFKTNAEYNNKNRLVFYCDVEFEVSISALMSANPTSSSQYTVPNYSNTKLYFVGDDLVLSKTGAKIHRIDLFTSASSNDVLTVNGTSPDASGNVTVTVGNDHSSEISNLTGRVTVLENTGGGGNNALYAPPQTLFLDTSEYEQYDASGNNWIYGPNNNQTFPTSGSPGTYLFYHVPEFENFFDNHGGKYKLAIYSGKGYTEVLIDDLVNFYQPSSTNTHSDEIFYAQYDNTNGRDNELWIQFINNDLILHAHTPNTIKDSSAMHRIYRIDMHLNAFGGGVTTVNGQTGDVTVSGFDGDYNSLDNKPTIPADHSSDITNLTNRVTTLESSGGGGNNALYAPPQTLFLNLDIAKNDTYSSLSGVYGYTKNGQPTSYTETYTIPEFANFKTTHDDKYKLSFYSQDGYREVIISDLISINPTSTNTLFLNYDDDTDIDSAHEIWFDGNDLVYKAAYGNTSSSTHRNRNYPPYRIDMHLNAFGGGVTTVNGQTGDVTVSTGGNWSTGWVNTDGTTTVENGVTLSFTHNLNSTDVIYQIHAADDANGTNSCVVDFQWDAGSTSSDQRGAQITDITDNNFKLRLGWGYGFPISPSQSTRYFNNRYVKVVARK